jgi:uncharacterized protein (DUF1015 family)
MAQIAGLRGVLPDPARLKDVVAAPASPAFDAAKGLAAGVLVRDAGRAVYRYHQAFADPASGRTLVRKMILCAVRLEPWSEGLVRPHEATVAADKEVERLFRKVEGDRPTLEVTTSDHTAHRLWRVQNAELLGQLRHNFAPKKLLVLDGHDRYEALLAYRDELGATQPLAMYSSANYGLMCLVNLGDPTLIADLRPRVIRGAGSSAAALEAAKKYFIVEKLAGAARDVAKQRAALADTLAHQPAFVVAWGAEPDAWKLTLSPDVSPTAEGIQVHRALQRLEPVVTDLLFIARVMPGAKVEAAASPEDALAAKADAVVLMRPLTVEQISHVAEVGQVLPAAATVFRPRLAVGLVSAVIDPDEDLV